MRSNSPKFHQAASIWEKNPKSNPKCSQSLCGRSCKMASISPATSIPITDCLTIGNYMWIANMPRARRFQTWVHDWRTVKGCFSETKNNRSFLNDEWKFLGYGSSMSSVDSFSLFCNEAKQQHDARNYIAERRSVQHWKHLPQTATREPVVLLAPIQNR